MNFRSIFLVLNCLVWVSLNTIQLSAQTTLPNFRINVGGEAHVDSEGNQFLEDQFFNGGNTFDTNMDILDVGTGTNTSNDEDADDILYQTERFSGNLIYSIPVPNGIYNVRLHFAEIFFDETNSRVFDVLIEGQTVVNDLDVFGARENAFTPGNFASLVLDFGEIEVDDGFMTIQAESQGSDGINNAKISAIEVLGFLGASVAVTSSEGTTTVSEAGNTDTIAVVLTQEPTDPVTVTIGTNEQVTSDPSTIVFTSENFDTPQTVTIAAVQDDQEEGLQTEVLSITATSDDAEYDGFSRQLFVLVIDDDTVKVNFDVRTIASFNDPTAAAFGPDGRLYVANQSADLIAYEFDANYNVVDSEPINTIANLSDSGSILGIGFNPFESVAPGETPTLYVSRSFLDRDTVDYESSIVALSGTGHSIMTPVVTGLPVSGFDHGVNGIQFDGVGNLLASIGGNTNTGVFDGVFGSDAPESPLTSAVLRAAVSDPNFNGDVVYEFIDPNDPEIQELADDLGMSPDPNNQQFGEFVQVVDNPGQVEPDTFAVGLRNSYDLVFTTRGQLFATDNGPNGIAMDELNLVSEGDFLGHPSIPRGRLDPRQILANAEYDPDVPSTGIYTAPLAALPSSTNGIDEYRSQAFNGQLKGQLIAQRFNNGVFFFQLNDEGTEIVNINQENNLVDGLDILTGPGGVIFGIDRNQDRITLAEPVDDSILSATVYDIFPFRAPAEGGNQFIIGGRNFGNLQNTTVLVDGVEAQLISVEDSRIVGIFPEITDLTDRLRDVVVTSDGDVSVLEESFLPLQIGVLLGDVDRNGEVNLLDIAPFVDLLINGGFQFEADTNQDGVVDLLDIESFVALLAK